MEGRMERARRMGRWLQGFGKARCQVASPARVRARRCCPAGRRTLLQSSLAGAQVRAQLQSQVTALAGQVSSVSAQVRAGLGRGWAVGVLRTRVGCRAARGGLGVACNVGSVNIPSLDRVTTILTVSTQPDQRTPMPLLQPRA